MKADGLERQHHVMDPSARVLPIMPIDATPKNPDECAIEQALSYVRERILDGLRHGFFELTVTCELVKDRRRRLIVKSGKSERFNIPADETDPRR